MVFVFFCTVGVAMGGKGCPHSLEAYNINRRDNPLVSNQWLDIQRVCII